MGKILGHQEFWQAGSRFYFKRDPVNGVIQPLVDLGRIEPANPNMEFEKVTLEDSDGGINQTIVESVNDISETVEIVCSNMNNDNLAILFLAEAPKEYTQAATERTDPIFAHPGRLVQLEDSDGLGLFEIDRLIGLYDSATATTHVVTDIVAATKTITTSDDSSALAAGDIFIVKSDDLADPLNAKSYTVVSATGAGPTDIVVEEAPAADETSITGVGIGGALEETTDYTVYNAARGIVKMTPGGATFVTAAELTAVWMPKAISGARLIVPQSIKGSIEGVGRIYWGRENHASQHVREGRVSMTPGGTSIGNTEFSNMTLSVRFLSDLTKEDPSGRLLHTRGTLPATS